MDQANVRPNGGEDMCAQICLYTVSSHSIMPVRSSPERWKGLSSEISLWLSVYVCSVALVVSNSLWPYGLSPPGSSVHGLLQARTLERGAVPSSVDLLTQGSNRRLLCLLHCGGFPLGHWGSPLTVYLLLANRVNLGKWFHPAEFSFPPGEGCPDICFARWFLKRWNNSCAIGDSVLPWWLRW